MKTRIIVTAVAYLIGVREDLLEKHYNDNADLLEELKSDENASRIRNLCMIRNEIMRDYLYFVDAIDLLKYGFGRGLDKLERTKESAGWLRSHGTEVCLFGKKTNDHQIHINDLLAQHINSVRKYFGQDIDFEYVKDLFVIPGYKRVENLRKEARKFGNYNYHFLYPFEQYIHWKPEESGLILDNDLHFINVIYRQNNDSYHAPWNYTDADEPETERIRRFLENAEGAAQMYVDSENVDLYQLVGMLEALDSTQRANIRKIVIIRDQNNHQGWDMINSGFDIPVEHHHAVRILDGKSSVDPDLMLDAAIDYHENNIRNIIIISSDVDFSSLIRKISANYLVFYQRNKTSERTLQFYNEMGVCTAALNSFAGHRSESFKTTVFRNEIKNYFTKLFSLNGIGLANEINEKTSMHLSETELKNYYKRYIKGMSFGFRETGELSFEIPN